MRPQPDRSRPSWQQAERDDRPARDTAGGRGFGGPSPRRISSCRGLLLVSASRGHSRPTARGTENRPSGHGLYIPRLARPVRLVRHSSGNPSAWRSPSAKPGQVPLAGGADAFLAQTVPPYRHAPRPIREKLPILRHPGLLFDHL